MDRGPKDHFTARHYGAKDSRGPLPCFNPTRRHIPLPLADVKPAPAPNRQPVNDGKHASDDSLGKKSAPKRVYHVWRSRDNRKGRHAIAVTEEYAARSALRPTSSLVESLKGVGKMLVRYPVWDVSYDVALVYTIGMLYLTMGTQ